MKSINETFEDKEFEELQKLKGELTWREFILKLALETFFISCSSFLIGFEILVAIRNDAILDTKRMNGMAKPYPSALTRALSLCRSGDLPCMANPSA